ncbi:MAG: LytTR family DNA-binding domain-containing protein [Bacteroidota bacterium]
MDDTINAIIVDDHKAAQDRLTRILQESFPRVKVIGATSDVKSGIRLVENNWNKLDLLFLDIELPPHTGFQLIEQVRASKRNFPFEVVFVSAYGRYLPDVVRLEERLQKRSIAFLKKPVEEFDLKRVITRFVIRGVDVPMGDRIDLLSETEGNLFFLTHLRGWAKLDPKDIIYCEGEGSTTKFFTTRTDLKVSELVMSKNIGHYKEKYSRLGFINVNRGLWVNPDYISKFNREDNVLILTSSPNQTACRVYLSRSGRQRLKEWMDQQGHNRS